MSTDRPRRRVAITGVGAISAIGLDAAQFWASLSQGRSGIRRIEGIDAELRSPHGAQVEGYEPERHFDPRSIDLLDRFAQFALIAAREAVAAAGLSWHASERPRTAVITGTALGGRTTEEKGYQELYARQRTRLNPLIIPRAMGNAGASHISMAFGLTGPCLTVSTACAAANHAIGQAFWMVRAGVVDRAIAGGSEAPFTLGVIRAWEAMRVMAPDTCRPFSRDRRGFVLGEGAGMLVLEEREHARARGAPILAEIVGCGMSADAAHLTDPSVEGASAAMRGALADGEVPPEAVGYINAHGTGTQANDVAEARAIHAVFGAHAARLAVSSSKSMHGHALGATGGVEAVATVLSVRHGVLPPTANFTEQDPRCDLDVVPNTARAAQVDYALSNAFAFGGLNATLAFRRAET